MPRDRFVHSKKVPFDQGKRIVPDWENLSPVMVRRFLEWKALCDTRWGDAYTVTVRVAKGTQLRTHTFTFEERAHAMLCEQWWSEINVKSFIKVL